MKNWNAWAQQKQAIGDSLTVKDFLAAVQAEVASEDDETQGQALVELASVLRSELLRSDVRSVNTERSQQIIGLLEMAEGVLGEDPFPAMSMATHLHYDCNDSTSAYSHALRAVKKAKGQHEMVRQTVGELIRISINLKKFDEVESSLEFLSGYAPKPFSMEIPLESDFLSRVPKGAVNKNVLARYREELGKA